MSTLLDDRDVRAFPPDTTVINYMRKQNLNWPQCVKEMGDNSWDAGATWIRLTITPQRICMEDNGAGCADLIETIRLGGRIEHDTTQSGQYGVGLKDAAIWGADRFAITSVSEGQRSELAVDWRRILDSGQWILEKPVMQLPSTEPTGTRIDLTILRHKRPDKQRLIEDLGRTYMPALQQGKQIFLKYAPDVDFVEIPPFRFPALDHQHSETIDIAGKRAVVTLGLIPEGTIIPGQGRGLMYIYGPRVIQQGKRLGIPQDALPEVFGAIEFTRAWAIEKNKTEFLDADLDVLETTISERFATLFGLAMARRTARPHLNLERWFTAQLKPFKHLGRMAKGQRGGPHVKEGTKTPTGEGSPHKRAKKVQSGDTFRKPGNWYLRFTNDGPESDLCKLFEDTVCINEDHPAMVRSNKDEAQQKETIAWAAAVMLGTEGSAQLELPLGASYDVREKIYVIYKQLIGINGATSDTDEAEAAAD
jgi:hypothetical protein